MPWINLMGILKHKIWLVNFIIEILLNDGLKGREIKENKQI